jgi:type II secretory pathway pseudopilin PulG
LIEIIVVVAIVALIATIGIVVYTNAKKNARDSKRKLGLCGIQTALNLYYQDNSAYPVVPTWWGTCANGGSKGTSGPNGYIPNLAPAYIEKLPTDPTGKNLFPAICGAGDGWACYIYYSDGTNYKLLAHCTPESAMPTAGDPFYDPVRPTYAFTVCNTGNPNCGAW